MDDQTAPTQASPETSPAIKIEDVIRAFSEEVSSLRRQLWDLQAKVSRYDRIYESIFREELDRRVGQKDKLCDEGAQVSPLWRLEKMAAMNQQAVRGQVGLTGV